jgi:hypothetical protein
MLTIIGNLTIYSQEEIKIGSKENVIITYQLTKLVENPKKDKYLISVSSQNKNDFDLYYPLALMKNANGTESVNLFLATGFAKITIRNSTGWFGDGKQIEGQQTKIKTENNELLVILEKQKIYNFETEFNVKHGDTPIITNSYLNTVRKLSEFNLMLDDSFINGVWNSNCGNNTISLTFIDVENVKILLQSVNGKQIRWIKQSATTFIKESDSNSTLSFSKAENKFYYTSSDGNNCEWNKK